MTQGYPNQWNRMLSGFILVWNRDVFIVFPSHDPLEPLFRSFHITRPERLVGSEEKLLKNAPRRDELKGKDNITGLEMEAAGTSM